MAKRRRSNTLEYRDIHIDSDFSDTKDPGNFTIQLQNSIRNVTSVGVHTLTFPQVTIPFPSKTLRWTMDEEKDSRASVGHPAIYSSPGPSDCTVFTTTFGGNFNSDLHYKTIGDKMVKTMHSQSPAISSLHETTGISTTNLWRATPSTVDTASVNDPVSGEAAQTGPLNQFDPVTPVDIGATVEYNFTPRITVRINKDSKTEIYSNFKLRLRPAAYNGLGDQKITESMAETMGFTITTPSGTLIDDPGVRTYLRQARLSPTASGETYVSNLGEYINGQYYYYKLTSEQPANFQPNRYLFVTTPNIFIRSQQSNPVIFGHNVLCKIPLTDYGTVATFTKDTFVDHRVDVNDIDTIYIRLIDEEGVVPDFQGVGGLSFQLRIWYEG